MQACNKNRLQFKKFRFAYTDTNFNSDSYYYVVVEQLSVPLYVKDTVSTSPTRYINHTAWISPIWVKKIN